MHMQLVRAQEERPLCDTCNAILILPFTLQHLCNTRVTVENIHEITSDVVIMIIAVLLCLSPRDSGRVYNDDHLCGALKCNVCLHRCHMSPWRPMSPSQLSSTATHSITGGRQRGLYQNIDRDTHCMLHQALMWLILKMYHYYAAYVHVHWYWMVFPFFEQLSIAMCWQCRVSGLLCTCTGSVPALTSSRQRILRSQVTMAVVTWRHNIPRVANILTDTESMSLCHHRCCCPFSDW